MINRRFGLGAECAGDGVAFRVYADKPREVQLHLEGAAPRRMEREDGGYHSLFVPGLKAGARYGYMLDGQGPYADPASRGQPQGPHKLSEVVASDAYTWRDANWRGAKLDGQIIYELHVGVFTPEGTWRAAIDKLAHLRDLGVTLIEMMPVACYPGDFGWGYDGVSLFAPAHQYGAPDDLRAFVDAAHEHKIGVILDVVYNHLGPDGNYLGHFSERFFTRKYENEWGAALNFELKDAPMRQLVLENARYWIEDFHFDGLRLDATQSIHDDSPLNVMTELARVCRAATTRDIVLVGENEPQRASLLQTSRHEGAGIDALWNDDFHHSAVVAATGRNDAYYEDHFGEPQEFISAAKHGFLFQGQRYAHQDGRRGEPALSVAPIHFVNFIENHDQVANSGRGRRLHQLTSPGAYRTLSALMLLTPGTPMLFQGQEFASSAPFLYFADHQPELAKQVADGRRLFLGQFESLADPSMANELRPPHERVTFESSKLDWREAETNQECMSLYRDLIALRQGDDVLSGRSRINVDGSVLSAEAFLLRYCGEDGDDRLLMFNFGRNLRRRSIPDPLTSPPRGRKWSRIWSSEHPDYGGNGLVEIEHNKGWTLTGHSACVLRAVV
ncbi:MAG: Alpha-amylase-family protein [Hyphomicrobiales bacterium]|nr:Alpha-amylase-family protein [Hyphomicrobiales bacterium]